MLTRRESRRSEILDAAFEEWGRLNFRKTSLSLLVKRLEITKPALYRYFSSKEALLHALETEFIARFNAMHRRLEVDTEGFDNLIRGLAEALYGFFALYSHSFVFFLMHMLRQPLLARARLRPTLLRFAKQVRRTAARDGLIFSDESLAPAMHFLYGACLFWLAPLFLDRESGTSRLPDPKAAAGRISMAVDFCRFGLLENRPRAPVRYEDIEAAAWIHPAAMPPADRIFSAIEETVAEVGVLDASLDRIAARVGMSKSSLYFHFTSKDDMLTRLLEREQDNLVEIVRSSVAPWPAFESRCYAYMVAAASYVLNKPAVLTVINWLRFQTIEVNVLPTAHDFARRYFAFFLAAEGEAGFRCRGGAAVEAAAFLHGLTYRFVMDLEGGGLSRDQIKGRLRKLHSMYLHGIADKGDS